MASLGYMVVCGGLKKEGGDEGRQAAFARCRHHSFGGVARFARLDDVKCGAQRRPS
jgi:hypothetical protein